MDEQKKASGLEVVGLVSLIIGMVSIIGLLLAMMNRQSSSLVPQSLGSFQVNYTTLAAPSSTVVTTGNPVLIAVTNTGRVYLRIQAQGGGVWLGFGTSTPRQQGEFLPASSTFQMNLDNMFTGSIYAAADLQTVTTTVIDFSRKGGTGF